MTRRHRTTIAIIALAVAVVLPTTAWYVTGSSEASRRAALIEQTAVDGLQRALHRDSDRLAVRLERLRSGESGRPFHHYQSLTHDPRGASEGLAVAPSPLAEGVSDPLVWAHFQLDEHGLVTLPMVNERFPELSSDEDFSRFCSLLAELQNTMALGVARSTEPGQRYFEGTLERLPRSEWEQIRDADQVYAAITGRERPPRRRAEAGGDEVIIRVGPMEWHTVVFGSGPTLAAVREVETPLGIRVQGFVVAPTGVAQWLGQAAEVPVVFGPSSTLSPDHLSSPVGDTGWWLSADASPLIADAGRQGREAIRQFRGRFALGASAVVLSTVAVAFVLIRTERLARQRGRFAAAAAHELKTPLASLRLYSEMLAEGLGRPEQTRVYAARVAAESGRLGRVVSNMLDLVRLERGAQIANPKPGDVGHAVRQSVERALPNLDGSGLAVDLDIADDLPVVSFDEDALAQILDNLLDNADKYTRGRSERRAVVTVRSAGQDGVAITVCDNGPGVPPAARRDLFEPFRRPDDDDAPAGLGLGLALARSLARAQGGELELDRSSGPGACFRLTLSGV